MRYLTRFFVPLALTLALAFTFAFAFVSAACSSSEAAPSDADRDGVRQAVELYFKGHATGDGDYFRRAFHAEARVMSVKDGALAQRTLAEFAAGFSGKPAADEAKRVRRLVLVDITGDAAIAKLELDYPGTKLTDYLSLLKVDGKWTIVGKIFTRDSSGQKAPAVPSR